MVERLASYAFLIYFKQDNVIFVMALYIEPIEAHFVPLAPGNYVTRELSIAKP